MKSFFAGGRRKKEKVILAATVDENSLVFVVVHSEHEKHTVVAHDIRSSNSYPGKFLLEDLIKELQEKFFIQDLVVSFGAPYFEIQSTVQSVHRVSSTLEITKAERRVIESKMAEQAERQLRTHLFEDSGILPADFLLQKIRISQWKIDGYSVPHPEGYKGQQVQGCALGTFLREDYYNFIITLKQKYRIKNVQIIHPFEAIQRRGNMGVFLYIIAEKTQALIVNKESFGLTESLSLGGNTFRDIFQKEFGMMENIAEEFERKYIAGNLSEEVREKVYGFLLPEVYNFGTLVREKLAKVKIFVPPEVFVFGGGVRFKEILQMLAVPHTNSKPFKDNPTLAGLLPKDSEDKISFPKEIGIEYTAIHFIIEEYYA